jgi:hypothetical protein
MAKKSPRKEDEELVDDCGILISCDKGGDDMQLEYYFGST